MKELMIHIERIVRPVRATARRKLRMRRELLAHLQAALMEEQATHAGPPDDNATIQRALRRLGDPAQLTRELASSVPLWQRLMLARIPLPRWYEQWEMRTGSSMQLNGVTMLQSALLIFGPFFALVAAMLLAAPVLWGDRAALRSALAAASPAYLWGNILAAAVSMAVLAASYRLVSLIVKGQSAIRRAAVAVLTGLTLWTSLIQNVVANQPFSTLQFAYNLAVGAVLIAGLSLLGRLVGAISAPYRPWTSLDIAS